MYIPSGFTVITSEPVTEAAFRAWAESSGGVWHSAQSKPFRQAKIAWEFPSGCEIEAYLKTPAEEQVAEWTPRMHTPPQCVINVEIEEWIGSDEEEWTPLIRALLTQ